MSRISFDFNEHGATVLTGSGVHRLDRGEVVHLFNVLRIRPTETNLRRWLADQPSGLTGLFYPEFSHKPRARTWPGCNVCDHKMRDQIEHEIDEHRSRHGIAARHRARPAHIHTRLG
jgi:hypothetical protein